MIHYLYKITNLLTGEYYLGVRSTSKSPELDPYMGSSSVWTKIYIKEHKDELKKEILDCTFISREMANCAERKIIQEHINDPLCINISIPGEDFTQYGHEFPEWKKRLYKLKFSKEKNAFYGKHHTEKSLALNREKHTGINNSVSKPIRYTNLETKEIKYFGSLNLCVKYINGSWVPFKKQIDKGRPYKKFILQNL